MTIIETPNGDRATPAMPTRIALPRRMQSDLFSGWGIRVLK